VFTPGGERRCEFLHVRRGHLCPQGSTSPLRLRGARQKLHAYNFSAEATPTLQFGPFSFTYVGTKNPLKTALWGPNFTPGCELMPCVKTCLSQLMKAILKWSFPRNPESPSQSASPSPSPSAMSEPCRSRRDESGRESRRDESGQNSPQDLSSGCEQRRSEILEKFCGKF
jgi:hypothetical protein